MAWNIMLRPALGMAAVVLGENGLTFHTGLISKATVNWGAINNIEAKQIRQMDCIQISIVNNFQPAANLGYLNKFIFLRKEANLVIPLAWIAQSEKLIVSLKKRKNK